MKAIIMAAIILTLSACVIQESAHIKDGKKYGVTSGLFRGRWWNYYERGLSYAEGAFNEEAVTDFKTAIEKRNDDQWRSRTYGMHFVNYFPHRELGIIYFNKLNYTEAERELEISLKTADSAKAKHYLNETRKAILGLTGSDTLHPSIRIDYPTDNAVINNDFVNFAGEAEDDYYVSSLLVNNIPYPIELAEKKVSVEQRISLRKGLNAIRIQAYDLTGKTAEKILNIQVDRDGPTIIIDEQMIQGHKLILRGFITDSSRVSSLFINGQSVLLDQDRDRMQKSALEQEIEFNYEIDIPEGMNTILIKAEDTVSNVTTGELQLDQSGSAKYQLPLLASIVTEVAEAASDTQTFMAGVLGKLIDDTPPEIHFKKTEDKYTVYTDIDYFEGRVTDSSKIQSLKINGESILQRKGKSIFFNYLATLAEGANSFHIEAIDTFGNKSEKVITVHRKTPKIRQIGSRMSISILPLERKGGEPIADEAIYDILISSFVNQNRFQMIEREKIEDVISELKLSRTELVNPETASEIGKIVVADAILTGSVYVSNNAIEVFTRLVDTETSDIIDAKDVFIQNISLQGIKQMMDGLAVKYKQSLPLLEGLIIKKDGKSVLTNLGENTKIKKDMRMILFRDGDSVTHPVSNKILGSEPVELGEAKIDRIYNEFSRAAIKRGKPEEIRIKDKAITK